MSTWSSAPVDALLKVGGTWVRASQIESIKSEKYGHYQDGAVCYTITVRMISGQTHEFRAPDPDLFARKVMNPHEHP